MLNLGQLLGSGIFSVPGVVLNSVGSIGLSLSFWVISPIFALGAGNLNLSYYSLVVDLLGSRAALLYRIRQLLPRAIWCRGCIPRASLPSPKILCANYLCYHRCTSLVRVFPGSISTAPH